MKQKKYLFILLTCLQYLTYPVNVFAQFRSGTVACAPSGGLIGSDFKCSVYRVIGFLDALNPILFSLSFVVFFWGLSKFVLNSGSKEEIEKGKSYMVWAIFALFVMISFRAIISFFTSDFGFGPGTVTPQIPQA